MAFWRLVTPKKPEEETREERGENSKDVWGAPSMHNSFWYIKREALSCMMRCPRPPQEDLDVYRFKEIGHISCVGTNVHEESGISTWIVLTLGLSRSLLLHTKIRLLSHLFTFEFQFRIQFRIQFEPNISSFPTKDRAGNDNQGRTNDTARRLRAKIILALIYGPKRTSEKDPKKILGGIFSALSPALGQIVTRFRDLEKTHLEKSKQRSAK